MIDSSWCAPLSLGYARPPSVLTDPRVPRWSLVLVRRWLHARFSLTGVQCPHRCGHRVFTKLDYFRIKRVDLQQGSPCYRVAKLQTFAARLDQEGKAPRQCKTTVGRLWSPLAIQLRALRTTCIDEHSHPLGGSETEADTQR